MTADEENYERRSNESSDQAEWGGSPVRPVEDCECGEGCQRRSGQDSSDERLSDCCDCR